MQNNQVKERFKLVAFTNRSGSTSWRVMGTKLDGKRVRENYTAQDAARARKTELDLAALGEHRDDRPRMTTLDDSQLRLCEAALPRLDDQADLPLAIEHWRKRDKNKQVVEAPRLDEAVRQFRQWVADTPLLRPPTKAKLRVRLNVFRNGMPNAKVNDITTEAIKKFLNARDVSAVTRVSDRQAISRFFSWCSKSERRWVTVNPCKEIEIEAPETSSTPPVLSVAECEKLMQAAEANNGGACVPYLSLCLWAGIRPAEVQRLTQANINLADGEIRIESQASKTKRPRIVTINETLKAWLTAYKGKPICPPNLRKEVDAVKAAAGFTGRVGKKTDQKLKPWPVDILRHTAVSHYFRKSGSYGLTAEQFGNSEAVIRQHYQGRVSTEETAKFYAIMPASTKPENIVQMPKQAVA